MKNFSRVIETLQTKNYRDDGARSCVNLAHESKVPLRWFAFLGVLASWWFSRLFAILREFCSRYNPEFRSQKQESWITLLEEDRRLLSAYTNAILASVF